MDLATAESRLNLTLEIMALLNAPAGKKDLIREILLAIKQASGFEAVGIRLMEEEDFPYYEALGFENEFLERENSLCARDRDGDLLRGADGYAVLECMCGNVIRGCTDPSRPFFTEAGSFWTQSTTRLLTTTTEKDRQAKTRNYCNAAGYETVGLIPLRCHDEVVGLLQLNDTRKVLLTEDLVEYFERLGSGIGAAIARKRAEQELAEVIDQLEGYDIGVEGDLLQRAEHLLVAAKARSARIEKW